MGNYTSCLKPQNTKIAKLIDTQGQVNLISLPTTVAEIMLENPGFAISPVNEITRNYRVLALKADNVLLGGKVYLLLPFERVNSKLSESQLAAIDALVSSIQRRTRGGSKVSPVIIAESESESGVSSSEDVEALVKSLSENVTGLAGQRNVYSKAWEPVLEPIIEV